MYACKCSRVTHLWRSLSRPHTHSLSDRLFFLLILHSNTHTDTQTHAPPSPGASCCPKRASRFAGSVCLVYDQTLSVHLYPSSLSLFLPPDIHLSLLSSFPTPPSLLLRHRHTKRINWFLNDNARLLLGIGSSLLGLSARPGCNLDTAAVQRSH